MTSATTTRSSQVAVRSALSTAVQVTVVLVAVKKSLPDGGEHSTDLIPEPSVAFGANATATATSPRFGVARTSVLGQVIVGSVTSITAIWKKHDAEAPLRSNAVQVTKVVVLSSKLAPDGGEHVLDVMLPSARAE